MNIIKTSILTLLMLFSLTGCDNQDKYIVPQSNKIIVLCYHAIGDNNSNYTITAEKLKKQVDSLLDRGYKPIGMDQLYDYLYNKKEIPAKSFLLTFDDALISDYEYVFPFLVKNNLKAIFFVPTGHIGRGNHLDKKQIREMNENDCCDFGSHSVSHKNLYTLSQEVLDEELGSSKKILEEITGEEILSFAYPSGFFTERDITSLRKYNYKLAVTVMPGLNDIPISPFEVRRIIVSNSISDENFKSLIEGDPTFYQQYYTQMYAKSAKSGLTSIARLCEEELRRYRIATKSR
ncbi:MAG: polysaccharide deacetylase family protein [Thermodesulfobacteriota bacterium]